jgi:hypothetical protein
MGGHRHTDAKAPCFHCLVANCVRCPGERNSQLDTANGRAVCTRTSSSAEEQLRVRAPIAGCIILRLDTSPSCRGAHRWSNAAFVWHLQMRIAACMRRRLQWTIAAFNACRFRQCMCHGSKHCSNMCFLRCFRAFEVTCCQTQACRCNRSICCRHLCCHTARTSWCSLAPDASSLSPYLS